MVRSARIHRLAKDAARFGTTAGAVELDWPAVVRRQHDIVREFQPLPASLAHAGAEVVSASARSSSSGARGGTPDELTAHIAKEVGR